MPGGSLKLEIKRGVVAGRRLWGAKRTIDLVIRDALFGRRK